MQDWNGIANGISKAIGKDFVVQNERAIGGGCINEAVCLEGKGERYFVKLNQANLLPMFEAEAKGLAAIRASPSVSAPQPIAMGLDGSQSWLALEYIEFGNASSASALLGEKLAGMHCVSGASFGWQRDNTIGSTPQINTPEQDWVTFLRKYRLGYQLDLAYSNGASSLLKDTGEQLLDALPAFFGSYQPSPSLLHGDLWGGNWATASDGSPVIFDPAVYYGDREADLAMTELFGGFDDRFYQSYRNCWDIDPGYTTRKVLYNLYHVLNHFNLFGGSYARQAQDMINQLNAEVS